MTNLVQYGIYYISAAIATNSALWFARPAGGPLVARDDAEIIEAAQERCVVAALTGATAPQWYSAWPTGSNSVAGTTPSIRTFAHAGNNVLLALQDRAYSGASAPAMFVWRTNGLASGGSPSTVAAPTLATSTSGGVTTYTYNNSASQITEETIAFSTRQGASGLLDAYGNYLGFFVDHHPIAEAIYDDVYPIPNPVQCAVSLPFNGVIWPNARPYHWVWEPATNYYGGGLNRGDYFANLYNRTPAVTNYNELASVLRSMTTSVRIIIPQLTNVTVSTKSMSLYTNQASYNVSPNTYMSLWNTGTTSTGVSARYPYLLSHQWTYHWVTDQNTGGGNTSWTISQSIKTMTGNITEVLDWPSIYAITNGYVARLRVYAVVTLTLNSPQSYIDRAAPVGTYGGVEYSAGILPWSSGTWALSAPDETGIGSTELNQTLTRENKLAYLASGNYFTPRLNLVYDVINPTSATNSIITFAAAPGTPTQPPYRTRHKRWTDTDGKRHGIEDWNCCYRLHLRQLIVVVDWNWKHTLITNH